MTTPVWSFYAMCAADQPTVLCFGNAVESCSMAKRSSCTHSLIPWSITDGEQDQIKEYIDPVFDQCSFYDSYEGALIRVFHFSDRMVYLHPPQALMLSGASGHRGSRSVLVSRGRWSQKLIPTLRLARLFLPGMRGCWSASR